MAANDDVKKEELSINEQISLFIHKNGKRILIGFIAIILIIVAFAVYSTVREKTQANALAKVDEFERKYDDLKTQKDSDSTEDDADVLMKQMETIVLLSELEEFAGKTSGFAGAKAYSIIAGIYADQENWARAEEAWIKAAGAAEKSYLASFSVFNAAVAAEEQENTETAILHYKKAAGYGNSFPSAARAQFSIGRLEESRNNKEAAIEAYRFLLSNWPNDPVWPNLAQSRILVLSE